jgi:hypothetical protein
LLLGLFFFDFTFEDDFDLVDGCTTVGGAIGSSVSRSSSFSSLARSLKAVEMDSGELSVRIQSSDVELPASMLETGSSSQIDGARRDSCFSSLYHSSLAGAAENFNV